MEEDYNLYCKPQQLNSINNYKRINNLIKQSYKNNEILKDENESIKILDIGCSLGLNSIYQINSIINEIRSLDKNKLIEIYHSDLPINNFTLLFNEINNNSESYLLKYNNVFSYAIGKSYEQQLVPNSLCDIIFSYNCFHWVDPNIKIFKNISKDLIIMSQPSSFPIGYDEFCTNHLTNTLLKRYNELKIGGILSCNFSTYDNNNPVSSKIEFVFKLIKNIYRDIANDNNNNHFNLTHDQVDSIYAQIVLFKNEHINYAIKQVELKGLKLINKEQIIINWNSTNKDPASNLASYIPIFTKRIKNDNIDKINNEFKRRLIIKYNENPNQYDFTNTFDLLLFKKIK